MATKSQRAKRRRERLFLNAAAAVEGPLRIEGELPVEFQAAAGEGKLPTFAMTLYTGGKMKPRGFSTPVVMDLSTTTVAAGTRPFLFNHDPSQPVAHGEITVEGSSIKATGTMSVASGAAENIKVSAANGFPWKSSVGAEVGKLEFVEAGRQVTVNARKFNGPIYVARNNVVYEGSFVTLAGDNRSSATVAASLGEFAMGFEAWLKAKGIELTTLSDALKNTLQAAYDLEMKAAAGAAGGGNPTPPAGNSGGSNPPPTPITAAAVPNFQATIDEGRRLMAAEATRVTAINALFAKPEYAGVANMTIKTSDGEVLLKAHAIGSGDWTADAVELQLLRASRASAPAVHSTGHDQACTLQALQGAMVLRAGLALDHKCFATEQAIGLKIPAWLRAGLNTEQRQKAMEAAWQFRDMSMYDIAMQAIRLDGRDIPSGSREDRIMASFSGTSLSNIFTTNVNAVLLSTYMQAPDTTLGWTSEAEVGDFRTQERPRVTVGEGLKKLPAGGTAEHVTDSDLMEEYKIARYARQFTIDEQDILSDRFGIMKDKPTEFGKAAARLRPDLVYYLLLANRTLGADNVALFHAASHGNLRTGSALASATLKVAVADFMLQRENNVNLNLKMTHLIVPPSLKHPADEFINSATIVLSGNTDAVRGSKNTLQDENLTLVCDGRLENGVTDPDTETTVAGSATTWFGASTMAHTIEVGYLRGSGKAPQVRAFTLDRGQWGMGWDVKHDIGAKELDYKGLHKNTA